MWFMVYSLKRIRKCVLKNRWISLSSFFPSFAFSFLTLPPFSFPTSSSFLYLFLSVLNNIGLKQTNKNYYKVYIQQIYKKW